MTMIDKIWRLFCSLKLTAWLIAWLSIGAFAGMFVDQTLPIEVHLQQLDGRLLTQRLFTMFELNNVFGSWWFMGLVVLLCLNLIACTLERLPRLWREVFDVEEGIGFERLQQMRVNQIHTLPKDVELSHALELALKRLGARVRRFQREDGVLLVGTRQRWARFAAVVIHISLLIVLFGHVGNTLFGLDAVIRIDELGQSNTIFISGPAGMRKRAQLEFSVRCDDFRLETFVGGRPKDYESDLVVLQAGQERKRQTIRVNTPLEYAGYTFYQSSYQALDGRETVVLRLGADPTAASEHRLAIGERLDLGNGTAVVPAELGSGMRGREEALRVLLLKADGSSEPQIIFKNVPFTGASLPLTFVASERPYATILSVAQAPFTFVVFIGFAALILGTLMATLMAYRRYWILLQPVDGAQRVLLAAQSRQQQNNLSSDLDGLWKQVEAVSAPNTAKQGVPE